MNATRPYQVCSRCILDTNDYPEIVFDNDGVCNICHTYEKIKANNVFEGEEGKQKLEKLLSDIRESAKGKEYDCVLTISGGTDSSYLAYLCKQWGLNPIALHVDNGWNSELAVKNIEEMVRRLGFDLCTFVIDWQELRDLQLAYFKSSVIDLDIPSENALLGAFYRTARKYKLKYILTGHNIETEGWLPPNFTSQYKLDTMNLRAIQKRFGTMKLKKYPSIGFFRHFFYTRIEGIKFINPLNYVLYEKEAAKKILEKEIGWRDYGAKHYENVFTRFYQGYILPKKYGIDKRKAHYSTLICSGQFTREEAIKLVSQPPYTDSKLLESDKNFLIKKLGMSEDEFESFMHAPEVPHAEFPSYLSYYKRMKPLIGLAKKIFSRHNEPVQKN
ncbi:MAG: N-acetyl sugar amidotransferase [Chitinophagales bacterium]